MSQSFGHAMRAMRDQLGLSQLALAAAIGTTQRHLSFLESGRSHPSRDFVARLATGLALSASQRAALTRAAGFAPSSPQPDFDAAGMAAVLDTVDRRLLRQWPFPAFVMDADWTVLRANRAGQALLSGFGASGNDAPSFLDILLSRAFRDRVLNWDDASMAFYFRIQAAAEHSARVAALFAAARDRGHFDHVARRLTDTHPVPPYIPLVLTGPDGTPLQMTSLVGHLSSIHEAALEALEIELMVPLDDVTEACLTAHPAPR